jgi:hypothetical protein
MYSVRNLQIVHIWSLEANQSVTVLGQEQTFHKFDVHSFSILPLILVYTMLFMLEQLKNLYRHILLEILLPPPRGEQGADYSSSHTNTDSYQEPS